MNDIHPSAQGTPELSKIIGDARALAREQVLAAWQLHIDRVREQLESGWRELVDQIFDQRFSDVEACLREGFEEAVAVEARRKVDDIAVLSRRQLTDRLNGTLRRLQHAESEEARMGTLLDAAAEFCARSACFSLSGDIARYQGARGGESIPDSARSFPLRSAPAFATAAEGLDTVVAAVTPEELSPAVAKFFSRPGVSKVYLFPLVAGRKALGIFCAQAGDSPVDVSALELLTAITASTMENASAAAPSQAVPLIQIARGEAPAPPKSSWSDLPKPEQEMHLRAQRFARTHSAELLLHKVEQVRTGRASKNLYEALKEEIDTAREAFREQFMATCPSMVDYLHLELVRTLAKDDSTALGPDYPGPLL